MEDLEEQVGKKGRGRPRKNDTFTYTTAFRHDIDCEKSIQALERRFKTDRSDVLRRAILIACATLNIDENDIF